MGLGIICEVEGYQIAQVVGKMSVYFKGHSISVEPGGYLSRLNAIDIIAPRSTVFLSRRDEEGNGRQTSIGLNASGNRGTIHSLDGESEFQGSSKKIGDFTLFFYTYTGPKAFIEALNNL